MYKIVRIDASGVRTKVAIDLAWSDALTLAMDLCVEDRVCRYEILDANDDVIFESHNKSARRTRGFVLHKRPRSPNAVN